MIKTKKSPKKKKTTKEKLDALLDIAAEEMLDKNDEEPFLNERETPEIITSKQLTKEIQLSRPTSSLQTFEIPENTEEKDFEFARNTLYNLVKKASTATDGILDFCEEAPNPRSYEVAGQLLKITTEIAKEIITLRKTKAEINKFKLPGDSLPSDIKNPNGGNVFILEGTTAEVLEAIRKAKDK